MRKRKLRLALAILLLAVFGGVAWLVIPSREPVYQGRTINEWFYRCVVEKWRGDDQEYDSQAFQAMQHFGDQAIPCMVAAFNCRDTKERRLRLQIWYRLPVTVRNRWERERPWEIYEIHYWASCVVSTLHPEVRRAIARKVIPSLISDIRNISTSARAVLIRDLRELRPDPSEVLPDLKILLVDPDPQVREASALVLWAYGKDSKPAVSNLIQAVNDSDADVAGRAIAALGEIGPEAKPAIPTLFKQLTDNGLDRRETGEALLKIDSKQAPIIANLLVKILSDPARNSYELDSCSDLLGEIGPPASNAVPALIKLLNDPEKEGAHDRAVYALESIDPAAATKAGIK